MKIKIFTKDENGNISMTKKELEELLNEAYYEGYNASKNSIISYPSNWPGYCTCTTSSTDDSITITSNSSLNSSLTVPLDSTMKISLSDLNTACDLEAAMRATE